MKDYALDAAAIAEIVNSVSLPELAAVVEAYGDRLLLNARRHLLVVQGNACNAQALEAMVFLSPAKAQALQRLGVRPLDDFLASEAPAPPTKLVAERIPPATRSARSAPPR